MLLRVPGLQHSPHPSASLLRMNRFQCTWGCRMDTSAPSPPWALGKLA